MKSNLNEITIHTDGACRGNPGLGGWGAVLQRGNKRKEILGAALETTNNRMELTAAIRALEALKSTSNVLVITDSQYVRRGITEWIEDWKQRDWKTAARKPVKNIDLWQRLDELVAAHKVHWQWVKGHSGDPDNERADALANKAMDQLQQSN